jgi:hypothetical protein
MDVVAPEAGRKMRAKILKSLFWRKESEAGAPPFWRFGQGFSAQKTAFYSQRAPLFVQQT